MLKKKKDTGQRRCVKLQWDCLTRWRQKQHMHLLKYGKVKGTEAGSLTSLSKAHSSRSPA